MIELSLVLPVINEEKIIQPVVKDIIKALDKDKLNYELILVENGSTDNTLSVLQSLAKENRSVTVTVAAKGYGSAVLSGLKSALGKYVGYMPSDGQIDPEVVPQLLLLLKKGKADLVKVRRTFRENPLRKYNSIVFNLLVNCLFRLETQDANGDPKIFLRKELNRLNLTSKDSFLSTELLIKARYLKWKVEELPIRSLPRAGGKSTVSLLTVVEFLKNMLSWKFGQIGPNYRLHK